MKRRILTAAAVALAAGIVGLTSFALARQMTAPRGFTIHAKTYSVAPDGSRREVNDITIYVSAAGDVRDIKRATETGEITDTLKLISEGAVYRIGSSKLHYIGKWGPPSPPKAARGDAPRSTVAGHEVRWQTLDEGRVRIAVAHGLQGLPLYLSATDREGTATFVMEAYSVVEGEPPADLFRKPDKPVSRELFESNEAMRGGGQPRKNQ